MHSRDRVIVVSRISQCLLEVRDGLDASSPWSGARRSRPRARRGVQPRQPRRRGRPGLVSAVIGIRRSECPAPIGGPASRLNLVAVQARGDQAANVCKNLDGFAELLIGYRLRLMLAIHRPVRVIVVRRVIQPPLCQVFDHLVEVPIRLGAESVVVVVKAAELIFGSPD